jgi:hypothetical protein
MAVVLAGHGHLDLLVALARHDPDPNVRASAMTLVVRQAEAGRVPWSIVADRLREDEATVCIATLGQLHRATPPALRSLVLGFLDSEDRSVRLEAFQALLRLRDDEAQIESLVLAWLDRIDPLERALAFTRWGQQEEQPRIVRALVGASRTVRGHAIDALAARGWADIAPLLERDAELFVSLWESSRWRPSPDLADIPLPVLVEAVLIADWPLDMVSELGRRLEAGAMVDPNLAVRLRSVADRCQAMIDVVDSWDHEVESEITRSSDRELRDSIERARVSISSRSAASPPG